MYERWLWGIVPAIADPALTLEAFILLLPCFDYTPDNGQVFMSVAVPRQDSIRACSAHAVLSGHCNIYVHVQSCIICIGTCICIDV